MTCERLESVGNYSVAQAGRLDQGDDVTVHRTHCPASATAEKKPGGEITTTFNDTDQCIYQLDYKIELGIDK